MKPAPSILDRIRIASPCPARWEQMRGDNQVRFCDLCNLNVYDVSQMTRRQARAFMARSEGRVCARLYRRGDGTIITRDCPIGLRALRRRAAKTTAAIFATIASVSATVFAHSGNRTGAARATTTTKGDALRVSGPSISASLTGEITDPNRGPIEGARVVLTNLQTNEKRIIKSDEKGRYHFVVSEFGLYELRIEAKYFGPFQRRLELHLSDAMRVDVVLEPGGLIGVVVIEPAPKTGFDLDGVHVRVNENP